MASNLERYREDLKRLIGVGEEMHADLRVRAITRKKMEPGKLKKHMEELKAKVVGAFEKKYQSWYTEAHAVVGQLIPDRVVEFRSLYESDSKRKQVDVTTFAIQDWLLGRRTTVDWRTNEKFYDDEGVVTMKFAVQLEILKSAEVRFESKLLDLQTLVRADLFDSEVERARELLKAGFLRAAGVVAGVVLEAHLRQVCDNHKVRVTKKHATISDLNDLLKNAGVYDVAAWRNVQRLGDLRNLCGHKKDREPRSDEVGELADGVEKVMKTIL